MTDTGTAGSLVLRLCEPADRSGVLALFEAANRASAGTYAPPVTCGAVSLGEWFDRKHLDESWVACTDDGDLVGHVGATHKTSLPFDWGTLPSGRDHEISRLAVHPDWTRRGVGRALLRLAAEQVGPSRCWLTTHVAGHGRALYTTLGWYESGLTIRWPDDPQPGVLLLAPPRPSPGTADRT